VLVQDREVDRASHPERVDGTAPDEQRPARGEGIAAEQASPPCRTARGDPGIRGDDTPAEHVQAARSTPPATRPLHRPGTAPAGVTFPAVPTTGPPTTLCYRSGDELELEHAGHTASFTLHDFTERCEVAATVLGVVRETLDAPERADLVELVASGQLVAPTTPFGRHLQASADALGIGRPGCFVYWVRRLVFEAAWLDDRVARDIADVIYDDLAGAFRYHVHDRPDAFIHPAPKVRFRAAAYRP